MDWMPKRAASAGLLSTSTLATFTRPACSAAISLSTGAIILHGPHHSAQKSTRTGWLDWRTSRSKFVSLISMVGFIMQSIFFNGCFVCVSRLAAEGAMIVEIKEIEPCVDVFAQRIEFLHFVGELAERLVIAVRRAAQMIIAPRGDFPRLARCFRIGLNPGQQVKI